MKIKIVDAEIDGTLEIESPGGITCGVTYFNITVAHNDNKSLPEIDIHFTAYPNILGKSISGYISD